MIRNNRRVVAFAIAGAVAIAPVLSGCGAGQEPQTAAPTRLTEAVNAFAPSDKPANPQVEIRNLFVLGPKPDQSFESGSDLPLYAALINQVKGREDKLIAVEAPDFTSVKIAGGAVALPPAKPTGEGTVTGLVGTAPAETPSASPSGKASGKAGDKKSPKPNASASASASASADATAGATPEPTGQGATPTEGSSPSAPSSNTASPSAEPTPVIPPGKAPLVVLTGLKRQLLGGEHIKVTLKFANAGDVTLSVPVIPQQHEYASYSAVSNGTPRPGATAETGKPAGEAGGESHAPAGH